MEKLSCYLKKIHLWSWLCGMILLTASFKMAYVLQDVANILYVLTLLASIIFLVGVLFKRIKRKKLFDDTIEKIFALIMLFFLVSTIVNFNAQILKNVRALIVGMIFFFILFQYAKNRKRTSLEEQLHRFNMIIIVLTFIYGIVMCFFIFYQGTFSFINFSGSTFEVGWYAERIIGIYGNGNSAGAACFISFAISIIEVTFARCENHRINKIIYANIIVQLIGVLISASRSGFIAMVMFGLIYGYAYFYQKKGVILTSAIKAITYTGVVTVILLMASSHIMEIPGIKAENIYCVDIAAGKITQIRTAEEGTNGSETNGGVSIAYRFASGKQYNDKSTEQTEKTEQTIIEVNESAEDETSLNQYSSGRIDIWKSAFQILKKHPILGAGLYGLEDNMRYETDFFRNYEDEEIDLVYQNYFSMHNDFIQAFVSGGLIGGILLIGLIIILLFCVFVKYLKLANELDKLKVGCLLAFIIGMLSMSMFLYIFYFDAISTGGIFWFYFGVAYYYLKEEEQTQVENAL